MPSSGALVGSDLLASDARRFSARQEEVLDVVEQVLLRDGLRGVRMGQLATAASCSRSTLYELATSKEDLLLLVLDRIMRRIMRRGGETLAQAVGPAEQLRATMMSGALDFESLGPRFLEAVRQHPPARLLFDRRVGEGLEVFRRLIDDGIEAGEFRPVDSTTVAEVILTAVIRFTDPDAAGTRPLDPSRGLAALVDVLFDGLRPRPPGGT